MASLGSVIRVVRGQGGTHSVRVSRQGTVLHSEPLLQEVNAALKVIGSGTHVETKSENMAKLDSQACALG